MSGRLREIGRFVLARLPRRTPHGVARRLILSANAARDARQWQVASALYEEVLRLTPTSRIHKQCGHMFKEAGQLDAAGQHYRAAEKLDPNDADLAYQIGHFEKIRGNLTTAEAAYRRALEIKPGWGEAQEELGRLRPSGRKQPSADDDLVPELLPADGVAPATYRETIEIRRLGRIARGRDGYKRVLGGVEAIRGFCVASQPLAEMVVLCSGAEIARQPLDGATLPGRLAKHSFNLWLDFSEIPRGDDVIELRFIDRRGRARKHRTSVEIIDPPREAAFPNNDAVVDNPGVGTSDLANAINARPSMVRPSDRAPLPRRIEAIFVQRIDQLGDLIVSAPALRRLRELFAEAHITLVVSPANVDFARTLDIADEVLTVVTTQQADGRRAIDREAQESLCGDIGGRRFDLAIDLCQGAESRPLLRLSRAPFTYGFRSATAPWLSASFDLSAPDPFNGLETCSPSRKLLAMIDAVGRLHEPLPPAARRGSQFREIGDGPYVILHAGARLEMNRWPYFEDLAKLLLERTAFSLVVMGTEISASLASQSRVHLLGGILPFEQFDAIVGECSVFVGNDSGPKHLAAARGVPAISLHLARLNWAEWGQEGRGTIISRRVPCAGCAIEQDPGECAMDFACLRHIRPEEVLAEIIRLAKSTA